MIADGSESRGFEPSDSGIEDTRPPRTGGLDPVAAVAIVTGVAGIFVLQLLLVVVTMILAAVAGQRARTGPWDVGYAYTAFGIGAVDGVLLLVGLLAGGEAPTPIGQ
jgi:hypothetical protein